MKEPYTDDAYFDSSELVRAVQIGIRSLDRLIDENYHRHPLKEQQEMSYNYRNIGLGVFGYATALMKLGLTYGSEEALAFTDSIFGLMFRAAVIESNRLAGELGPYPKYKDCVWDSDIMRAHFPQEEIDRMRETGLRNCSLISIAPTGSIATMLGESGGCEPEFAMKYTRRTVGMTDGEDTYYEVYCKPAREYMQINGTDDLPPWFVGAQDISWQNRIMTQAIMQKHVDTGISSTVNLPNEATRQDVAGLYLMAWKMGLKGVTIFRDGCKRFPILSTGGSSSTSSSQANEAGNGCEVSSEAKGAREEAKPTDLPRGYIINVSDGLVGKKRKLTSGCGSLHVTAFFDPRTGDLMETFLNRGSAGGCENSYIGLSRVISMAARAGCTVQNIADQLMSCGVCPSYAVRRATRHDTSPGACCPTAIGKALLDMWQEFQAEMAGKEPSSAPVPNQDCSEQDCSDPVRPSEDAPELTEPVTVTSTDPGTNQDMVTSNATQCPQCGSALVFEEGCVICKDCGWSKCS